MVLQYHKSQTLAITIIQYDAFLDYEIRVGVLGVICRDAKYCVSTDQIHTEVL